MILADTGPLVALQDRDDRYHAHCVAAVPTLGLPLLTTLPVLTEAMYLLGSRSGWPAQERLWQLLHRDQLQIIPIDSEILASMAVLMEKYRDAPMDFADASLVAVAEARKHPRLFTLDSHFHAYRLRNGKALQVLPAVSSS